MNASSVVVVMMRIEECVVGISGVVGALGSWGILCFFVSCESS